MTPPSSCPPPPRVRTRPIVTALALGLCVAVILASGLLVYRFCFAQALPPRFENAHLQRLARSGNFNAPGLQGFTVGGVLVVPSFRPKPGALSGHIVIGFQAREQGEPDIAGTFGHTDFCLQLYSREPAKALRLVNISFERRFIDYSYQMDLPMRTADTPNAEGLYEFFTVALKDISTESLLDTRRGADNTLDVELEFEIPSTHAAPVATSTPDTNAGADTSASASAMTTASAETVARTTATAETGTNTVAAAEIVTLRYRFWFYLP